MEVYCGRNVAVTSFSPGTPVSFNQYSILYLSVIRGTMSVPGNHDMQACIPFFTVLKTNTIPDDSSLSGGVCESRSVMICFLRESIRSISGALYLFSYSIAVPALRRHIWIMCIVLCDTRSKHHTSYFVNNLGDGRYSVNEK